MTKAPLMRSSRQTRIRVIVLSASLKIIYLSKKPRLPIRICRANSCVVRSVCGTAASIIPTLTLCSLYVICTCMVVLYVLNFPEALIVVFIVVSSKSRQSILAMPRGINEMSAPESTNPKARNSGLVDELTGSGLFLSTMSILGFLMASFSSFRL